MVYTTIMIYRAESWRGRNGAKHINEFDGVKNQAILEPQVAKASIKEVKSEEKTATKTKSKKK